MELVVKLTEGKKPFIGIYFDTELNALRWNKDAFSIHKDKTFNVIFEFYEKKVNVKLVSKSQLFIHTYEGLSYQYDKLNNWVYLTKQANEFTFSHVFFDREKKVDSPIFNFKTGKALVLKVSKYEIVNIKPPPQRLGTLGVWSPEY